MESVLEESQKQRQSAAIARMDKVVDILGKIGAVAAGIALVVMTILMASSTIGRYLFGFSWHITEELTGLLLLYVWVLGLLYVLVLGRHIRVSIIFDRLPAKLRAYLWVFNSALAAAYAGFVVGQGMALVREHLKYNVHFTISGIPEAVASISIPIGAGLFGIGCLALLVKQVIALINKSYNESYEASVSEQW